MTERGLPIVGGAPACPFVAFEDDRDERATSPDHRHRCYAEAQPAPRALAHQEAYCLSSAFPVCPTFQDWARREAARARPADVPPVTPEDEDEEGFPPLVADRPPRRSSRDAWTAPPPWLRPGSAPGPEAAPGAGSQPGAGPGGRGDDSAGAAAAGASGAAGVPGGLSGSFADRMISERPSVEPPEWEDQAPAPGAVPPGPAAGQLQPQADAHGAWDARPDERPRYLGQADDDEEAYAGPRTPRRRDRSEAGSDRIEGDRDRDVGAPSWERPRRLEAYPTLRSRNWSNTALPTIALGLVALLIAAGALFLVPQFLGSFGPQPGASPTPSVAASVAPAESVEPSVGPGPTPFIYTVQQGDTLTKIANKFGISLTDLIDANRDTHPNPDILKVGDQLIIPTSVPSELPAASAAASP